MTTTTFSYKVRDEGGTTITGTVEGANEGVVANSLRLRGYRPIEITPINAGLKTEIKIPGFGDKVKLKELAAFARQFSTMIAAAVPMLEALSVMIEQTENPVFRKTLGQVRNDVESGQLLSYALAQHPRVFPALMVSMIKAGESSDIVSALQRVANNYEAEAKLKSKIKAALAYPAVVFALSVIMCIVMLVFVVPVFSKMFAQLGGQLPAPTRFLVDLSNALKSFWYLWIGALVGSLYGWGRYNRHNVVRKVVDPIKLKMPVFGQLNRKLAISRFARNFAGLYGSGVPIQNCLDLAADASGNLVYANLLKDAKDVVSQGRSLSTALDGNENVPIMVVQMIRVGEDAGQMDEMMEKVADYYDEQVEAATEALMSMIEPIMIAVLGGMVGSMLVALYLPIFKIYSLVQQQGPS